MQLDTEITIDLQEVKDYIENTDFSKFLLDTVPSFGCAAFVLQTLLNAVEEAAQSIDNSN